MEKEEPDNRFDTLDGRIPIEKAALPRSCNEIPHLAVNLLISAIDPACPYSSTIAPVPELYLTTAD